MKKLFSLLNSRSDSNSECGSRSSISESSNEYFGEKAEEFIEEDNKVEEKDEEIPVKQKQWEISFGDIFPSKENFFEKNSYYDSTCIGKLKLGSSLVDVVIKKTSIDDVTVTREKIINVVLEMKQLEHRNILKVYGCCFDIPPIHQADNMVIICLEHCQRGSFRNYLQNHKDMKIIEKMNWIVSIAEGMEFMHSKEVIHRDLRPRNIYIGDDGNIKICDKFSIKQSGLHVIPPYLAPEQFFGETKNSPKFIDIYSFGIIIWEIWTGKIPFEELQRKYRSNAFSFLVKIHGNLGIHMGSKKTRRPDLKDENLKDCPKDLIELMYYCWEVDPKNRPDSFTLILEDLDYIWDDYSLLQEEDIDEKERVDYVLDERNILLNFIVNVNSFKIEFPKFILLLG